LTACDSKASRGPTDAITFDTAKRLDDFVFLPRATAGRTDGRSLIATLVEDWRRSPLIQMKIANAVRLLASPGAGLAAVYWLGLGATGLFAAIASGFCIYAALTAALAVARISPPATRSAQ